MLTVPSVSGFSVSGTRIFESKIAPGAVMITAVRMCWASMPNARYAAITPPETWAMPEVMTVSSSERVSRGQVRANRQRRLGLAQE